MEKLQINAALQIQKPVNEVYEAIVDPQKMSNYFIAVGSGRMETGKTIIWKFPEFDIEVPVKIVNTEKDKYIAYTWDSNGRELLVEMMLYSRSENDTLVKITEGAMENNEEGIKWLKGNTEGWANFLACLKAYLEYGINLRKGAFDFLSEKL